MFFFLPEKAGFPRHVKFVILVGVTIFAVLSGTIPAFQVLSAEKLKEKQPVKAATEDKKAETVSVGTPAIRKQEIIRKTQRTALKREQQRVSQSPSPQKSTAKQNSVVLSSDKNTTDTAPEVAQSFSNESQKHIFETLNRYREKKGKSPLLWDGKLGSFAQSRSEQFLRENGMDDHAGFRTMFENNGPLAMGFMKMGENSSRSDNTDAVYIIESLYARSPGHEANQLHDEYTHVGIGVAGVFTDLVFGGRKR